MEDVSGDAMETYTTYEDYLDSQITDTDMFYLESEDLARQLVELGYRGSGDTLKREEFEARKKAIRGTKSSRRSAGHAPITFVNCLLSILVLVSARTLPPSPPPNSNVVNSKRVNATRYASSQRGVLRRRTFLNNSHPLGKISLIPPSYSHSLIVRSSSETGS